MSALHHVGLTVPDLAQAVRFLGEAFGCEELLRTPPGALDAAAARAKNVQPGVVLNGIAVLRGANLLIELFEYAGTAAVPPQDSHLPGAAHVAFEVADLEAAVRRAEAAGARACSGINTARSPGFESLRWVYLISPWGQTFELVDASAAPGLALR